MDNVQYAYHVAARVIDQQIVLVSDQLARTRHAPESADGRMVGWSTSSAAFSENSSSRANAAVGLSASM
jgi:hypothetical protein